MTLASSPLQDEDEQQAQRLIALDAATSRYHNSGEEAKYDEAKKEIIKIGDSIQQNGGRDRMVLIWYRVGALGGNWSFIDSVWGQW